MAKKEYRFEIEVSRGWGGVEQVRIAAGTDSIKELNTLVNEMAEAMQDRADNHQKQLKAVEDAVRNAQRELEQDDESDTDQSDVDNNVKE